MCRHSSAPPPRGLILGSLLAALGLPRSWGWACRGPRLERPVAPPGCALGPAACVFFSGGRAPGKDFVRDWASLSPGFQGGCSPGVPFPGGDRRPFWARSEGSVLEPPGAKALPRRESLGLGPGGISCGAGVPRPPVVNCFSPESVQGPAGLHSARAGRWVARRGKHALGQNHWVGAYSVSWVCPSVLVSSQSKSEGIAIPAS